jgi:hypothetical protein
MITPTDKKLLNKLVEYHQTKDNLPLVVYLAYLSLSNPLGSSFEATVLARETIINHIDSISQLKLDI